MSLASRLRKPIHGEQLQTTGGDHESQIYPDDG